MRDNLCGDVLAGIGFSPPEELRAYSLMLLIRRFEEKAGQLYALGAVEGPCHLAIGQEAVIAGLELACRQDDDVIAGFRCHGHLLARGAEPDAVMAELLGRETGMSGGRAGSTRMSDPGRRFHGGHEMPAEQVPLAAGLAFAARYRGEDSVTICSLGDGAASRGELYETLRFAADWRLPLVVVIDNNTFGQEGAPARTEAEAALAARGAPFAIPGERVDGIDVRKVRAAAAAAIERARRGDGPSILEMLTYRYRGHSGPPSGPREAGQREDRDPIAKSRARILADGIATDADLKKIEKDVRDRVSTAASAARAAPGPGAIWP